MNSMYHPVAKKQHISKHNSTCDNQLILLLITDGKKLYYLAVKKLLALLKA